MSPRTRPIRRVTGPRKRRTFDPDWVVAPGETLREWREDYAHLPASSAAIACARMPLALYEAIEAGTAPIDDKIAGALAHGTGIFAQLWLNLEAHYRAGIAAGKTNLTAGDTDRAGGRG